MRSDRDFAVEKPSDTFRIIVLGDSFGMGYEARFEESSLEILRKGLQESMTEQVEVLNLSVSGHGNAEELVMLERMGLQFQPDMVLLYYSSTDPSDNVRSELYGLRGEGTLYRDKPVYLPGVAVQQRLLAIPGYQWIADHSNLYNLVRDRAGIEIKKLFRWLAETRQSLEAASRKAAPSGMPSSEPNEAIASRAPDQELTIAILREIERVAEANGAPLVILSVPGRRSRTEFTDPFPYDVPGSDELDVVSPVEEFHAHAGESSKLYWERGHWHWTPLGQRIVGELLVREISARMMSGSAHSNEP